MGDHPYITWSASNQLNPYGSVLLWNVPTVNVEKTMKSEENNEPRKNNVRGHNVISSSKLSSTQVEEPSTTHTCNSNNNDKSEFLVSKPLHQLGKMNTLNAVGDNSNESMRRKVSFDENLSNLEGNQKVNKTQNQKQIKQTTLSE